VWIDHSHGVLCSLSPLGRPSASSWSALDATRSASAMESWGAEKKNGDGKAPTRKPTSWTPGHQFVSLYPLSWLLGERCRRADQGTCSWMCFLGARTRVPLLPCRTEHGAATTANAIVVTLFLALRWSLLMNYMHHISFDQQRAMVAIYSVQLMLFLATIAWYSCDVTVSILYILIVYPFYDCTVVFQILGECGYISKIHCFLHLFKRIFYFKRKGNIFTVLYIFSYLLNYPDQYTTPIRRASYRLLWIIRIGAEVVIFSFSLSLHLETLHWLAWFRWGPRTDLKK
jgi:hypothetical protein